MLNFIGELFLLFQESAAHLRTSGDLSDAKLADDMDAYTRSALVSLEGRAKNSMKERYVLSFVGMTNVGKSTLVQALFGHDLAPICNGTTTAVPVEYEHAETWRITAFPPAPAKCIRESLADAAAVLRRLTELAVVSEAGGTHSMDKVIVQGPLPLLSGGLVMADTPGLGSANPDADTEVCGKESSTQPMALGTHDTALANYIKNSVDQVYYCVKGADSKVLPRETAFFDKIQHLVSHVVITQSKLNNPGWKDEYRRRYQKLFPGHLFIFVEAKWESPYHGTADPVRSNLAELRAIISVHANSTMRSSLIVKEALQVVDEFTVRMKYLRKISIKPNHWRADSWLRYQRAKDAVTSETLK